MARAASGDPLAALVDARQRLARHSTPPKALVMTYSEPSHPALSDPTFFNGVDAVLVVAPPHDATREAIERRARAAGRGNIDLSSPPGDFSGHRRRAPGGRVCHAASGAWSHRPTRHLSIRANAARIAELRTKGVGAPIVLGFGISNGEQARAAVGLGADGVVVGSAALRAALRGEAELSALLNDLRNGLND